MGKYRILALDGGGIRGLLTCVVLQRLQAQVPGWLNAVDLIAGTSTGGVIALGLAHGLSPTTLRNLYYEKGPIIFDDSWLDDVADLGRIVGAEYDLLPLERELWNVLGGTLLRELKKRVLIATFDLDNEASTLRDRRWKPKFFHNFPGSDDDGATAAYKVALYTSAAPSYFPSVDGYIDGGVVANSPSIAAIAQTQDERAHIEDRPGLEELVLLSLGTGSPNRFVTGQRHDWGYAQWARPLLQILLDGSIGIADYQCRQLLGERYFRLAPIIDRPIELDDWRRRGDLVRLAERIDLDATIRWLEAFWM